MTVFTVHCPLSTFSKISVESNMPFAFYPLDSQGTAIKTQTTWRSI